MHVTLKQLRVFVSITQAGTLTAAAERLNLTKPAISMALRELESHLGHPLFDRFRNRLLLNAYGEQLLPWADELLTRAAMLPRALDESLTGGTLTIEWGGPGTRLWMRGPAVAVFEGSIDL